MTTDDTSPMWVPPHVIEAREMARRVRLAGPIDCATKQRLREIAAAADVAQAERLVAEDRKARQAAPRAEWRAWMLPAFIDSSAPPIEGGQ